MIGREYPYGDEPDLVTTTSLRQAMGITDTTTTLDDMAHRMAHRLKREIVENPNRVYWLYNNDEWNHSLSVDWPAEWDEKTRHLATRMVTESVEELDRVLREWFVPSAVDNPMSEPLPETATPPRQEGIPVKSNPDGTVSDETWANVWYSGYAAQVEKTEKLRKLITGLQLAKMEMAAESATALRRLQKKIKRLKKKVRYLKQVLAGIDKAEIDGQEQTEPVTYGEYLRQKFGPHRMSERLTDSATERGIWEQQVTLPGVED